MFQLSFDYSNSNHSLIPNAHTTNILSNIRNMAILGYHLNKIKVSSHLLDSLLLDILAARVPAARISFSRLTLILDYVIFSRGILSRLTLILD